MKESEFIQLLNLYLDHEISGADAVRLEAEVQNNPARRKIYQQYCRMQKACKLLASDFETAEAGATGERKIIAFNPAVAEAEAKRRRAGVFYTVGSIAAAAACVAVIFVNRAGSNAAPAGQTSAAPATMASTAAVPAQAQVANVATGPRALGAAARNAQPKLVADPLLLTPGSEPAATVASTTNAANDQLQWLTSLQLAPLQQHVPAEDLRFDVRPATLRPEARAFGGNRAPAEATVEMTAFRFAK